MSRRWIAPALVVAMLVFTLIVFPSLPERIPIHWSLGGEPDGWADRWPGTFYMPVIALGVWLLLQGLRKIDPRREHYERFEETYWLLLNLMVLFLAVTHVLMLGAGLGWPVNMTKASMALLGVLFVGLGNYLPRVKSNWWIGIRTPWTLESETVWRKTHRVAGWSFVAAGLVAMAAAALPPGLTLPVAFPALFLCAMVPLVYSYIAWRKERAEEGS